MATYGMNALSTAGPAGAAVGAFIAIFLLFCVVGR
jgi:hypothetical protein